MTSASPTTSAPPPTRPLPNPSSASASARTPLMRAESAECTCPEFCERDHTNE
jgi:hypothetical protein